ncbi:MAG: putative acetyltransferase [Sphingomonadales bacterium]|jgi:putative acetyltransferase|nr:putative acetyltransferase [Sphingomonadales bacterium]
MLRPAEPSDAAAIRRVLMAAFPTAAEADLVEYLTRDGDAIVSLVAEREGEVIGHLLLSRMRVSGAWRAVGLGPVGVIPGFRGGGIGAGLTEAALAIARATGEDLVFVLGEPDYYRRFGFSAETAAPFASPYAGPYFMALALRPGVALPAAGEAAYARAFSDLSD